MTSSASGAMHYVWFEVPRPVLSYLVIHENRKRARPRLAMQAIAYGDSRIEWYAVCDAARREVHTLTPDEAYFIAALAAAGAFDA